MKRILIVAMALAIGFSAILSAQTALKIFIPGDRPPAMDQILAEAEKRMAADGVSVKLDLNFIPWSDIGQKTQLILASGENVDLIFDAPWLHLPQMVAKGYYESLDKLLATNGQQILKAIPKSVFDANLYDGHVMAPPLTSSYLAGREYMIRKDLREKLGIAPIKTWDELVKYAYAVKAKFPEVKPFLSIGGSKDYNWVIHQLFMDASNKSQSLQGLLSWTLYTKNNDGKIYNLFDTREAFVMNLFKQARKFYQDKIIDPDVLSITNGNAAAESGQYAIVTNNDLGVSLDFKNKVAKNMPGAEYEMVTFFSTKPGDYYSSFKAWNFIAVPKVSKNKELAIKFLNWAMASQDNYDLLAYGIKGTHWETVGSDGSYRFLNGDYRWFPFAWVWNSTYERLQGDMVPQARELSRFLMVASNLKVDQQTGFNWDPAPVSNEMSRLSALEAKHWPLLAQGVVDTDKAFEAYRKEAYDVSKKVQAEYQKQLDAFLKAKKK